MLSVSVLSARVPPSDSWPEMTLTAEVAPENGQWVLKQKHTETDGVVRKHAAERTNPRDIHDGGAESGAAGPMKRLGMGERRELKLARLKQIMQRSLSESDGDVYPPDETKHTSRPERPTQLPIPEAEEPRNTHSSSERKLSFTHRTSKSVDACNPSPSSDQSDPETRTEAGDKVTTSPKSALKSPSSRRKTSQNLKLRVTFDEPPRKDGAAGDTKAPSAKEKRSFGAFRSIMETLSGNQNSNNNNSNAPSPGKHTGKKSKSKTSAV